MRLFGICSSRLWQGVHDIRVGCPLPSVVRNSTDRLGRWGRLGHPSVGSTAAHQQALREAEEEEVTEH